MGLSEETKEYVQAQNLAVKNELKLWVISGALINLVAFVGCAIPIIFYLGGIYNDGQRALSQIQTNQKQIAVHGVWMQSREGWEYRVEDWASARGFKPENARPTLAELNSQLEHVP